MKILFDVSMPLDYNTPFIDNDCAERFEIAQNMAATLQLYLMFQKLSKNSANA
jgi:hypothetical protein